MLAGSVTTVGGDVVQQVASLLGLLFHWCATCHQSLARDPREEGSLMEEWESCTWNGLLNVLTLRCNAF